MRLCDRNGIKTMLRLTEEQIRDIFRRYHVDESTQNALLNLFSAHQNARPTLFINDSAEQHRVSSEHDRSPSNRRIDSDVRSGAEPNGHARQTLELMRQDFASALQFGNSIMIYHTQQLNLHSNDYISQTLYPSLINYRSHAVATYRPSRPLIRSLPENGANAKAIEHLDLIVPEEITCALSHQIMTDPVYFIGIQNKQCFEYSWIMDHLQRSNRHPITREVVREEHLVSNWEVKKSCDAFVANALVLPVEKSLRVTSPV